jgi:hypothetical protein
VGQAPGLPSLYPTNCYDFTTEMLRNTLGFRTPLDLSDHFLNHGARLRLANEDEYETFADEFLNPVCPPQTRQFVRRKGALCGTMRSRTSSPS